MMFTKKKRSAGNDVQSAFLKQMAADTVVSTDAWFSPTYAQSRARFLAASRQAGLQVTSEVHPLRGYDGEELALDVVVDGAPDAESLLLVSSGCHGVEGFAGSGAQVAMLSSDAWRAFTREAGVAVAYLHALNPHGFSFWRRVTDENVDLNRNFIDFASSPPCNSGYEELADLLVPEHWPAGWRNRMSIVAFVLQHGPRRLQTAISAGQYSHPTGLFYGGQQPTWSNLALRTVLRRHCSRAGRLGWIDLHTGLGAAGACEAILACPAEGIARARDWWGSDITSVDDGTSVSAPLTGLMWNAAVDECTRAQFTGIVLEFGTVSMLRVLQALRADQWLHNHPDEWSECGLAIRQRMREAFCIDEAWWRMRVADRVFEAARQAVEGLNRA